MTAYRDNKANRQQLWEDLKGWTKNVDLFQKQYLLFPINYDLHWSFALLCNPSCLLRSGCGGNSGTGSNGSSTDATAGNSSATPAATASTSTQTKGVDLNTTLVDEIPMKNGLTNPNHNVHEQSVEKKDPSNEEVRTDDGHSVRDTMESISNICLKEQKQTGVGTLKERQISDLSGNNACSLVRETSVKSASLPNQHSASNESCSTPIVDGTDEKNIAVEATENLTAVPDPKSAPSGFTSASTSINNSKAKILTNENSEVQPLNTPKLLADQDSTIKQQSEPPSPPVGNDDDMAACIMHFDSGKHFRLHRSGTIYRHIRKYMTACYEYTKAEDYPDCIINADTLPGISPPVPVQTNTKDCGVYMLEIIERIMEHPPVVTKKFVRRKGVLESSPFGNEWFEKKVTDFKRVQMQGLINELKNRVECMDN